MVYGRKRRANVQNDAESNGGSKKIKKEEQDVFRWEWEDDGSKWTAYSDDVNQEICSSFNGGKPNTHFTKNGVKFEILYPRMVQINIVTCWERRIRLRPDDQDVGIWEWQDEKGKWCLYEEHVQNLLHAGKRYSLKQVECSIHGKNYLINFRRMEQANKSTKARRKVRCLAKGSNLEDSVQDIDEVKKGKIGTKPKARKKEEEKGGASEEKSGLRSKSLVMKGKTPVDEECTVKDTFHVYYENEDIWDAMLNQTNLRNNNNKFYLMQLLEQDNSKQYAVWFRWGRVGFVGRTSLVPYGKNLLEAKEAFEKKFSEKTDNHWSDKDSFEKVQGKYDLLKMDYEASRSVDDDEADGSAKKEETEWPDSKLDKRVQVLVELICNIQEMEETALEMKYDAKKAPLGKLTKEQIKAGYDALKKIEAFIRKKKIGDGLVKACDEFYTRIPHVFGMQRPPLIKTEEEVQKKGELLEFLGDIEIALTVIKGNKDILLNPIDRHYNSLECEIEPMERDANEFQVIQKYLQNTHAKTHNTYKMEVQQIFKLTKEQELKSFNDCGNRMLLWHGSRLTNYVGILKQGLKIAPPEAPVTGYMFGKGIYFADMSSKSANYCYPSRSRPVGLVLLSEVAVGQSRELLAADYEADQLPSGFQSVKGLGKTAPDADDNYVMPDGTVVPLGMPKDTGVKNSNGYTLNYNEYIVYNRNQVKSKYAVQVKFHFT